MIADAARKIGGYVNSKGIAWFDSGRLRQLSLSVLGLVLFLAAWEGITIIAVLNPKYFPGPLNVYKELVRIWEPLLLVLPNTLTAAGVGFVAALVLSIVVAIPIVANERLGSAVMPFIVGMNTVPRIAVAPLAIYWVDLVDFLELDAANYIMALWVAFFPMLVAAIDGFRSIDEATENMLTIYGARTWQEFRYVRLQAGFPFIFDGMKLGVVLAMIGAVIGEFISSTLGIGAMAKSAIGRTAVNRAIAIVLVLGVVSFAVILLIYLIESRVVHWRESSMIAGE
jgi:NitT/TauT family transport system permease protein